MKLAYFDCFSGAGGDMIVAALLDAGADEATLRDGIAALNLSGYSLTIEKINKQGFAATRFLVELESSKKQPHRHLKDIVKIIEAANLSATVQQHSIRIFERLADAEAKVHGTTIDKVHFHEVGAVDAIIDIVGAVLAIDSLDVGQVICSPLPLGSGTVLCDHGVMPVPAPATAWLLKGVPVAESDEVGELVTPTAAAILTTLADRFGSMPSTTLSAIGYGAGTRDGQTRPNVLRVLLGQDVATPDEAEMDQIVVLETNLDDCSPEIVGHCMDTLLTAGVLDVFAVPIMGKKHRPGFLLTVLCEPAGVGAAEHILFTQTTTFGIRRRSSLRVKLARRNEVVVTPFGPVSVKIGERKGLVTVSPEFESCREAADKHHVAVRVVMDAARSAWSVRDGGVC